MSEPLSTQPPPYPTSVGYGSEYPMTQERKTTILVTPNQPFPRSAFAVQAKCVHCGNDIVSDTTNKVSPSDCSEIGKSKCPPWNHH